MIEPALHLLAWAFIIFFCNALEWRWGFFESANGTLLLPSIYGSFFNALIFYGNAFWLYPRKVAKKTKR